MFMYIVVGLLMGIIFGIALEKGRVFEPGMIVGQFQLRNFIVLRMFLSAIATSTVVIALMFAFGLAQLHPKQTLYPAIIIGGFLFGVGMALSGACPGTVLAQVGAGYSDAWFIIAGGLLGAVAYGYLEPVLASWNTGPGKIALADRTGVPFTALAIASAVVITVILLLMERWRPWRSELGHDYDGLLRDPEVSEE